VLKNFSVEKIMPPNFEFLIPYLRDEYRSWHFYNFVTSIRPATFFVKLIFIWINNLVNINIRQIINIVPRPHFSTEQFLQILNQLFLWRRFFTIVQFCNWLQTSVRLCGSGWQKCSGKIWLILKRRDVKIGSFFVENYWTKLIQGIPSNRKSV